VTHGAPQTDVSTVTTTTANYSIELNGKNFSGTMTKTTVMNCQGSNCPNYTNNNSSWTPKCVEKAELVGSKVDPDLFYDVG
jgi:hypothetical protein